MGKILEDGSFLHPLVMGQWTSALAVSIEDLWGIIYLSEDLEK